MQTSTGAYSILAGQMLRRSNILVYLGLAAIFGVLLPWQKGIDFLDPGIQIAYACLGVIFAGPASVQLFNSRPTSPKEALGRVAAAVVFGETIAIILLVLGLFTVRFTHRGIFPFDAGSLIAGLLLGLTISLALSALAAWVRLTRSETAARGALRVALIALLLAFVFRGRWLPDVALMSAGIALAVAVVFLTLLAKGVRA